MKVIDPNSPKGRALAIVGRVIEDVCVRALQEIGADAGVMIAFQGGQAIGTVRVHTAQLLARGVDHWARTVADELRALAVDVESGSTHAQLVELERKARAGN